MRRRGPLAVLALAVAAAGATSGLFAACGPFSDVSDVAFCPFVLEIFTLGITTGTTATTYDPAGNVTRLQMAAFLSRSVDGALARASRRALSKKFWTPQTAEMLGLTTLGTATGASDVAADGQNVWVSMFGTAVILKVRASDGKLLETWTTATGSNALVSTPSGVFACVGSTPGRLYRIDPSQPAGAAVTVSSALGQSPQSIGFDGQRFWTGNFSSISIVTPGPTIPWTATTVTTGFFQPNDFAFDGASMWLADFSANTVSKLDPSGAILQTVTVETEPAGIVFDGVNLWVPNAGSNSISIVRPSSGSVLASLTGNGLNFPVRAAFDGQRVLVVDALADRVSLWKAADLTPLGSFSTGAGSGPARAASDGLNFWILLSGKNHLARF